MSITTEAERNRYEVGLDRFRAELLDYDAGLLEQIGHTRDAEVKRRDAEHRRNIAHLTEVFQDAADAAGYHVDGVKVKVKGPDGRDPAVQAAYAQLDKARVAYREFKEREGLAGIVAANNDGYTEPSAEEMGVI